MRRSRSCEASLPVTSDKGGGRTSGLELPVFGPLVWIDVAVLTWFVLTLVSAEEPAPGTHGEFIRPLWKQGLGSTIHCVAR